MTDHPAAIAPPPYRPVQNLEGWIAPLDLYAAIHRIAEDHPDAKHICWDMLVLANLMPLHITQSGGRGGFAK